MSQSMLLPKIFSTAIAVLSLAIALPASAYEYTSEPVSPGSNVNLDSSPVLIQTDESGSLYASRGFWSFLADDRNLYVVRIFSSQSTFRGNPASLTTYTQIDCGRGQSRSLLSNLKIEGVESRVDLRDWRQFDSTSIMGQTCEAAASDRGINWIWSSEQQTN